VIGPRRREESGSALIEMAWLGILLLVPMVWIVLSVFEVQRGAFGVSAAARSAGRAFALAPDDDSGRLRARAAAAVAMADQGLAGSGWGIDIDCHPRTDCHTGGALVRVTITSHVSLPFLPEFLGGGATFALHGEHDVPIGQFQEPETQP
jgi:Flp pilus assembly protein TadG